MQLQNTINYDLYFDQNTGADSSKEKLIHDDFNDNALAGWTGSGDTTCDSGENASVYVQTTTDFNSFDGSYASTVVLNRRAYLTSFPRSSVGMNTGLP